jgi:hypothetical protein
MDGLSEISSGSIPYVDLNYLPSSVSDLSSYLIDLMNRVTNAAIAVLTRPINYVRSSIADLFFFQLNSKPDYLTPEKEFYTHFWNGIEGFSSICKDYTKILTIFAPPRDHTCLVTLSDGKQVRLTCRVIESKPSDTPESSPRPFCTSAFVVGNHSTRESSVMESYPYLAFYAREAEVQPNLPRGRFIIISAYDIYDSNSQAYTPKTLDEGGEILNKAICALQSEFGSIDQLVVHSLGTILLGASLKYFTGANLVHLPKNICWDRGPTSIFHASLNYAAGLGLLLFPPAYLVGWTLDLAGELKQFCENNDMKERTWVFNGATKDHRFYGLADLSKSDAVRDLQNRTDIDVWRLGFDVPKGLLHENAQHSINATMFLKSFLVPGSNEEFLDPGDNLADALMKQSLLKIHRIRKERLDLLRN